MIRKLNIIKCEAAIENLFWMLDVVKFNEILTKFSVVNDKFEPKYIFGATN